MRFSACVTLSKLSAKGNCDAVVTVESHTGPRTEGILSYSPCPLGTAALTGNGAVSKDGRLWSCPSDDHRTLEELIVCCGQDFYLGILSLVLQRFDDCSGMGTHRWVLFLYQMEFIRVSKPVCSFNLLTVC